MNRLERDLTALQLMIGAVLVIVTGRLWQGCAILGRLSQ
jgi:hypothetical protein